MSASFTSMVHELLKQGWLQRMSLEDSLNSLDYIELIQGTWCHFYDQLAALL